MVSSDGPAIESVPTSVGSVHGAVSLILGVRAVDEAVAEPVGGCAEASVAALDKERAWAGLGPDGQWTNDRQKEEQVVEHFG